MLDTKIAKIGGLCLYEEKHITGNCLEISIDKEKHIGTLTVPMAKYLACTLNFWAESQIEDEHYKGKNYHE